VVNRAADDKADATCVPLPTGCTLREAINASNAHDPGIGANTIAFDPITNGHPTTLATEIDLAQNVTIAGNGAANTPITFAGSTNGALTVTGSAALTVGGVTFSGGSGGVYTTGSGAVAVSDSVFTGGGAGIATRGSGAITVNRALFSGLTSFGFINSSTGPATVTNSSFSGNGIGVYKTSSAPVVVAGSTFSSNGTAMFAQTAITLTDSILAGSTDNNCAGMLTDGGHNLAFGTASADTSCPASFAHDRNPFLSPLNINGATNGIQTFALLPGSAAINSGTCAYTDAGGTARTLDTDARGVSRPQQTYCEVGAVESRGFRLTSPNPTTQTAQPGAAFASPPVVAVAPNGDSNPVYGGTVTFTIASGVGGVTGTFGSAVGCTVGVANTVATCTIAGGKATAPTVTANGGSGSFTATATTAGATAAVTFTLATTPPAAQPTPPHVTVAPVVPPTVPLPQPPTRAPVPTVITTPLPAPVRR